MTGKSGAGGAVSSGPGQLNQEIPKSFRAEATRSATLATGHQSSVTFLISVIARADIYSVCRGLS